MNSAKTWSDLDALVEWSLPKAREVVQARRVERQATNAGSQDLDERGRRVDDREFSETRDALRLLGNSAMGWYRQQGGFRADLVGGVYDTADFRKRGLPADHGIHQGVRADGREVMYWRETASGWALALALAADGGGFGEYLYAAADPPSGPPSEGAEAGARPMRLRQTGHRRAGAGSLVRGGQPRTSEACIARLGACPPPCAALSADDHVGCNIILG